LAVTIYIQLARYHLYPVTSMLRRSILVLLFAVSTLTIFQSCEQTCDVVPAQRASEARFVDAMAGVDTMVVYIDSTLFDQTYYNLADTNLYPQTKEGSFKYRSKFLSTGTNLHPGAHHIVAFSPSQPRIILIDTVLVFADRQTVVFMGNKGSVETPARALFLNDVTRSRDNNRSLARFIHTVTDLDSIDIYFSSTVKLGSDGKPTPDLRIGYGQVSSEDGSGHGTGVSASDYFPVPLNGSGLLITAAHDTSNIIFVTGYSFSSKGFFATVIVRGKTRPLGREPVVSSTVFADGYEAVGTYVFSTTTFAVRMVNATHEPRLSLAVQGAYDSGPRDQISLQNYVQYVQPDAVGRYWPLTPFYHGVAKWFLSLADTGQRTIDAPWLITTPVLDFSAKVNTRYTFVAIDSTPNRGTPRLGIVPLTDTMSRAGSGKTRVRFVNASADDIANFTFEGRTFSLNQGQVGYADAPLGTYDVPTSNGTVTGSMHFTLDSELPMTVIILPEQGSVRFPVTVAHN
jgi:hypothetical protein